MDAIRMLMQDHRDLEMLFDQYERASVEGKHQIVDQVCMELETHTLLEDEILYPAVCDRLVEDAADLASETLEEHHNIRQLIQQIRGMGPTDPGMHMSFLLMMEHVHDHVDQEETEMYPLVRSNMAEHLDQMGRQLEQRKREIRVSA